MSEYKRLTTKDEEGNWQVWEDGYSHPFEALQGAIDRLAEWENDYENGKLVKLPCKVGDTIWGIYEFADEEDGWYEIYPVRVREIHIRKDDIWLEIERPFIGKFVSEKICFTREEAEKRLKELQE